MIPKRECKVCNKDLLNEDYVAIMRRYDKEIFFYCVGCFKDVAGDDFIPQLSPTTEESVLANSTPKNIILNPNRITAEQRLEKKIEKTVSVQYKEKKRCMKCHSDWLKTNMWRIREQFRLPDYICFSCATDPKRAWSYYYNVGCSSVPFVFVPIILTLIVTITSYVING